MSTSKSAARATSTPAAGGAKPARAQAPPGGDGTYIKQVVRWFAANGNAAATAREVSAGTGLPHESVRKLLAKKYAKHFRKIQRDGALDRYQAIRPSKLLG